MRVAHILRKFDRSEWGGTESAIFQLTNDLSTVGVESVIHAPRLPRRERSVDPFAPSERNVRRFGTLVPIAGISSKQKARLVAVGGNLISFDLMGSLWLDGKLGVIHSHAQGRLGSIARVVAEARRMPFVLSIHGGLYDIPEEVREGLRKTAAGGWDWGKPLGFVLRSRQLISRADAIITFNRKEADHIRERHPGRRVITESHGVPTALFARDCRAEATETFPRSRGRSVLLVLGRIDPTKNQDWLIAQAAELVRRRPEALLVFVGPDTNREYADAIRARIEREGLQDCVMMVGSLPFGDPRHIGLLQLAKAVVLPSKSETFGIVIVEAWAAGTPVVSSRTSGAAALITEGVNGLMFDLERPETFHAAVDRVLDHGDQARQWGEAGRAKAVAEFDTSNSANRMRRLYEDLIEEKNALRHHSGR
jgi:alpha-maltose-1-phosphate synthase